MKFAHKLLLSVVTFMVVGIGVTGYYAYIQERKIIGDMGRDEAERISMMVFAELYASMRSGGGRDENRVIVKRLSQTEGIEEIRLIHGPSMDEQFGIEEDRRPLDELDRMALEGKLVSRIEDNGYRVSRFVMPFPVQKDCTECHNAEVGTVNGAASVKVSLRKYDMTLAGTTRNLVLIGAVILAMSVMASVVFLLRYTVKPISELQKAAQIIGEGDLDYRITVKDGFEINLLVKAFNQMAERLKQRKEEAKLLNRKLVELSTTDGLTGLFNHRHFNIMLRDELKRSVRYGRPLSLMMVDIDHFKRINDTYGHLEGDRMLKKVTDHIKANLRGSDLLARYGGEEFAVILPETGKGRAAMAAERMRAALEAETFLTDDARDRVELTISIGVASSPDDANNADDLLKMADAALYRAKNAGRNRVEKARSEGLEGGGGGGK